MSISSIQLSQIVKDSDNRYGPIKVNAKARKTRNALIHSDPTELVKRWFLPEKLGQLSVNKTWPFSAEEWEVYNFKKISNADTCLCGHKPIKNIFYIKNKFNNNSVKVGCCCVKKIGKHCDVFDTSIKAFKEKQSEIEAELKKREKIQQQQLQLLQKIKNEFTKMNDATKIVIPSKALSNYCIQKGFAKVKDRELLNTIRIKKLSVRDLSICQRKWLEDINTRIKRNCIFV